MRTLIFVLSLISSSAFAATDYTCMGDCSAKGYQYGYCKSACSYNNKSSQPQYAQPQRNQPKRIDYQCLSNCTSKGYTHGYCTSACSY